MAQVEVFTQGKWVGAGSQTVDPTNNVSFIFHTPAIAGEVGWKYLAPLTNSATQLFSGVTVSNASLRGLDPATVAGYSVADGTARIMYPVMSRYAEFPDGVPVLSYGMVIPALGTLTPPDTTPVFFLGIPTSDVNADTALKATWLNPERGVVSDYTSGTLPSPRPSHYTIDMVPQPALTLLDAGAAVGGVSFYAVTWGALREAMGLKAGANASNFLGYAGTGRQHSFMFSKTASN